MYFCIVWIAQALAPCYIMRWVANRQVEQAAS